MTEGICFFTPCYGGMLVAAHYQSCMQLKADLTLSGIPHDWAIAWNESLVPRARMELTATFLKTDWSHMMWIDADIDFKSDDVIKLWNLNADIAVGVYRMKKPESIYAAWKDGKLITDLNQFEGPTEVDLAGTGFMLINRKVIEKLAETAEVYDGPNGEVPGLYMMPIINRHLDSEDYYFCRKAREAGFKIVMDPSVRLGHWGLYRFGN